MNSEEDKNVRNDTVTIYEDEKKYMSVGLGNKGLNLKKIFMILPLTARIMEKGSIIMLQ